MKDSRGLNRLGIICPQSPLLAAGDGAFCKVGSALGAGDSDLCPLDHAGPGRGQGTWWHPWGSGGDGEGVGRKRGEAVLLLLVIALAWWGSGANFISLVSVVIASPEIVVAKGRAGWGRADAVAPFLSICEECPK